MPRLGKWEIAQELGKGGQGSVYLVTDTSKVNVVGEILIEVRRCITQLSAITTPEVAQATAVELLEVVSKYLRRFDEGNSGALKLLHEHIRKDSKALGRMAQEVEALTRHEHPHIIRILDARVDEGWFVTPYYPQGVLANHLSRYEGKPVEALEALRPVIEAIARLHQADLVHRDIKPLNIFLSGQGLVLGDFGLVHFSDDAKTRLSDTYENVGSRDWMPGWAMGLRLDDVKPTFDVFGLGKVLWAMISGKHILQLWYHRKPQFDVEAQFPDDERMRWVNRLLDGCIVESEDHCWSSAALLLENVDKVLDIFRRGGEILQRNVARRCRVCAVGNYHLVVDEQVSGASVTNYGLHRVGNSKWRIFQCLHCGHVQMFRLDMNPPGWGER